MRVLTLFILLLLFSQLLHAKEKEDVLKGIVLERINQFITYNDGYIDSKFKICIYKNKKLFKTYKKLYEKRKYKNYEVKVIYTNKISNIKKCNVLYAEELTDNMFKELMLEKEKKTLLVTDNIDYLEKGFMVALFFQDKKIKFAINQGAIFEAGLKVNYRLLKVASKVINRVKN